MQQNKKPFDYDNRALLFWSPFVCNHRLIGKVFDCFRTVTIAEIVAMQIIFLLGQPSYTDNLYYFKLGLQWEVLFLSRVPNWVRKWQLKSPPCYFIQLIWDDAGHSERTSHSYNTKNWILNIYRLSHRNLMGA